jgi:hypothetical protein
MHYGLRLIFVLTMVPLATACPDKGGDGSGTATSTGESSSEPTGTSPGGSSSESADPETTAASAGTSSDTGDGPPPAECESVDEQVSAAAVLTGWPMLAATNHMVTAICIVDSVTAEAGQVVTALTCTVDGAPTAADLQIADVPGGGWVVDWVAGDEVLLRSFAYDGDGLKFHSVELANGVGDAVLMASLHGSYDLAEIMKFPPLVMTWDRPCAGLADDALRSLRAVFTDADEEALALFSGHRGELAVDDGRSYAIDVEQFIDDPAVLDYDADVALLLRRVRPG